MIPLQTNGQANRGGASVVRSCDDWWEQLQSHNRHRSNAKLRYQRNGGQYFCSRKDYKDETVGRQTEDAAEINAKVDELLQMVFIEHSKRPYSSPIVMVKKKTGKWRLCVDFRQINAKSVKDAYPMPRINYILDQLREVPRCPAVWT